MRNKSMLNPYCVLALWYLNNFNITSILLPKYQHLS